MPLTPAQIAASVNNKPAPKQDYGLNNQINALPNSEKLTSVERGIYKALPGISENKTLQTIGGALSDFDKWLGGYPSKLLGYLDVGAEGVERTVGLLSQMQEKDFSIDELKSAWYAGGLTADVINLPTIGRDENGNISGIRVPTDLPGIQGLASARKEIQTLVEGGATYGDALKQVRESYYNNLGALALRAQLYDTYFHIVADPLNYIMPNLAPIDALQARRISALEKVAVNADEALQISSDILKHTDELNALLKTEKDAGKIAKLTAAVEENTRFAAQLAKGEKTLNTGDKIAIMLTGGDPFGRRITKLDDIATKVKDIPVLNWFQLTPAARAQETVMRVGDNIGSTLVQRLYNSPDFANEFKNAISRISQGAVGVEYGHAITTLEGRSVQSLVKGVEAVTSKTIDGFQSVQKERDLLNVLSQTLGESVESVLKNADANPEALLTRLSGKNPLLDQMVKNGEVSTETLKYISGMFKDGKVPYNKDMLIATVLDQIETQAMQQAVVQFGVKARGTVTRWAEAVKAAESLAFLRLNPAYPIRNMINNDVTMIARGVFGVLDNNAIDDYIKLHNLGISKKLSQGFTTAELSGFDAATDGANKVIQDALKGGNYGVPEKAKEFFQNLNFGAVDNKGWSWARNIESKASKRAFTVGHMEYMDKYAKYSRLEDLLDADVISEVQKLYPNFTQEYNNVVKAAAGVDGKLDDFLSSNLNVNTESVFEQASMKLGVDVKESLGTDILSHIKNGLPDAIKNNKVESFVMETRQKINDHIDDLFNKQLENQIEHVKSQVIAGGPQVWYQKMGDAQDMVSSVQTEHAIRMPSVTREAREAAKTGDYAKADILWRQLAEDDRKIFNRTFRRVEAYMEGMDKAQAELASRGINLPRFEEVKTSFTDWRKGWEDFFSFRNEKHREFFSNRKAGNWDAMQKEISSKYEAMGLEEDRLMQQIDDIVAAQIPDPLLQEAFTASRDAIAEIRQKIKQAVIDTRARVEDMPADKAQLEWNKLWQERQAQYAEVKNLDAMGRAIMQGDGKAANAFLGAPTDLEKAAGEGVQAAVLERIKRRASKIKEANAAGEAGKLVGEDSQKISEYLSTVSEGMTQKARDFGKAQREARGTGQVVKLKYEKLSEVVSSLPNEEASLSLADITKKASQYDFTIPPELKTFFEESGGYATRREILEFSARLELGLIEKKTGIPDLIKEALSTEQRYKSEVKALKEKIKNTSYEDQLKFKLRSQLEDAEKKAKGQGFQVSDLLKKNNLTRNEVLGDIKAQPKPTNFIGDTTKILPEPMPIDLGEDLMAYGRSYSALDAIVDGAKTQAEKTPLFMKDLPQNVQAKLQSAISRTRDEFSSVRNQALKYAGYKRDSALLNYNRRTNFDTMVGNIFPYAFWTTGSMAKWAIHSIDRPAMLTNYLRTKKFIETAGLQQDGLPSRVKGNIRIQMPFAPEWMGDFYVDPLRLVLPFDGFAQPFEQMQQAQTTAEGRTQRLLEEKLNSGEITQSEFDDAIDNQGALWEQAMTEVQQNDSAQKYDAWDFATTMSSPHAPIVWAYNAASGHTEDIGPFAPLSRLMRNAATLMGVKDWNNSSWNVEAKVRKQLGLNAFDKWDNYRIDRALSDLAGNGEYTVDEVKEAMYISALVQAGKLTPEQAKEKSPVYAKGVERSNQEFSGTPVTFALSLLGINVKSVPEGEMNLRRLQTQFSQAYEKYDTANQSILEFAQAHPDMTEEEALDAWEKANPKIARDGDALTRFFDEHPEYETRLGLFDKPEVKIQKFLIDQIWARYNDLPKVNKDEIREMLGPEFQESFLNKETRAPQNLTPEQLSIYLKLMGGDPVGTLTATESALLSLVQKPLTDPETANRVQVFYDTRQQTFGNYYDLQSEYFALDKSKRKQYLQQNPELGKYWDWRRDFMNNNPDLVPYLTDNMADIEKAAKKYREQGAPGVVPTAQEININVDPLVKELIADYGQTGEPLPPVVLRELDRVAAQYGLTTEQLKNILGVKQ